MKRSVMFHDGEDEVGEGAPLSSQHCSSAESNTKCRTNVREGGTLPCAQPWWILLVSVPRAAKMTGLLRVHLRLEESVQSTNLVHFGSLDHSRFCTRQLARHADSCRRPRFGVDSAQLSPAAIEWVVGQGWDSKDRWCENENRHCSILQPPWLNCREF